MKTPGFRAILAYAFLIALAGSANAQQPSRIAGRIDSGRRVTLAGRVHRKALAQNDLGRVASNFQMSGVTLVLKPSAAGEAALTQLLRDQQDPSSQNYQRWLTPEEFGARFGASDSDVQQITDWLKSQGLSIDTVARGRNWISVSGTADQIGKAFGTEIHRYRVDGALHYANATNPSVPAAMANLVTSITGLHDFRLKPRLRKPSPQMNTSSGAHHLAPDDIATIYDIAPLYKAGIDGTGTSIAVVGQTAIRSSDVDQFRTKFGLPAINLQQVLASRRSPGVIDGDVDEAHLDIEWSGAIARNATIYYVYSNDVWASARYAVNNKVADVITMSYGLCEQADLVDLPGYRQVAQQAAAQGMSWFAASGDNGAGDCEDYGVAVAQNGLAVDVPSSLPEVTGVGGTTFVEQGGEWAPSNDPTTQASALGYIRERVWNDSNMGELSGGGGGVSVIFPRPSWQTGPGVPNDAFRHVPDVSFASSPSHDSYYLYSGGSMYVGGTSVAAPVMAGVAALLNHYLVNTGALKQPGLGNLNPTLYRMAQTTTGVFHDVVDGDNNVPCAANTPDCVNGSFGHAAAPSYDMATGLGSLDVNNFVRQWSSYPAVSSAVVPSIDNNPVFQNGTVWPFTITLTEEAGIGTKLTDFTIDGASHASEIATLFGSPNIQPGKSISAPLQLSGIAVPKNVVFGFAGVDASGATWTTQMSVPFQGAQVHIMSGGMSNAASGQQVYAPGMIMSVYGAGMGNFAQAAAAIPLPTYLAGFTAYINSVPAPLYYVSPNQINVQIPYETQAGSAQLDLTNPWETATYHFTVTNTGPGVFTFQDGYINPSRSAARGGVATLFITGEGAVSPSVATGDTPTSGTPVSRLPKPRATVTVTVGGVPVAQDGNWFVGIPSGLVGVTQINFTIPATVPAGPQPVVVTVGGVSSNIATINVQ